MVPVQLVEAEWRGHLVHVLPAVLSHHLAAVVVELAVRATTEEEGHQHASGPGSEYHWKL